MLDTIAYGNVKTCIRIINRIIREAIEHGGDCGGSYNSNPDGLIKAMKTYINWVGLKEEIGILDDDGGVPQFFLKRQIVKEETT